MAVRFVERPLERGVDDHLVADARPVVELAAGRLPRPHRGRSLTRGVIVLGDVAAMAGAWALMRPPTAQGVAFVTCLAVALVVSGAHRLRTRLEAAVEVPAQVARVSVALFVAGLVNGRLSPGVLRLAAVTAVLLVTIRALSYVAVRHLRRRGVVADRAVLIGSGDVAAAVAEQLTGRPEHGIELVGYVDDHPNDGMAVPWLGPCRDLDAVISRRRPARVVIAFSPTKEQGLIDLLRGLASDGVEVDVVPRFFELGLEAAWEQRDSVHCIALQRLRAAGTRRWTWKAKRAFDVAVSAGALLVLAPLLLACALAVRLTSDGPVLFRQERVGQHGRTFELLKFRTLRVNDDSDTRWSVVNDDRQTRVGAWMRRFSVDELPQLWNVLRGDMSLIGPRPERPHFVRQFSADVPSYGARHRFPVGLTGWAQVNGLRGDTSIAERARYDNHYIDDWSLWRDLSILAATVGAVVRDARSKHSA